ncbi:hypothetical protein V6N11_054050 [Hibiscus sabdariffa]|uniref:RNase H type-1 domain-containing protein n=1 Tax=Hibiscus sabdariffa TaxID=183260 RepID=A0ABR2S317_9ROSI
MVRLLLGDSLGTSTMTESWALGAVGRCSVLMAELWVLHDMLVRAWSFGFRWIVIEIDCLEVIQILQRTSHSLSGNNLIASIRYWTDHNWELVIRHIPRTCNMLADKLSTWGRLNSHEVVTLPNPQIITGCSS